MRLRFFSVNARCTKELSGQGYTHVTCDSSRQYTLNNDLTKHGEGNMFCGNSGSQSVIWDTMEKYEDVVWMASE